MEGWSSRRCLTTMAGSISSKLQVAQRLFEKVNIFIYLASFHKFSNAFSHFSIQIACIHQIFHIDLLNSSHILIVYFKQTICGKCQNVKSNLYYLTKPNAIMKIILQTIMERKPIILRGTCSSRNPFFFQRAGTISNWDSRVGILSCWPASNSLPEYPWSSSVPAHNESPHRCLKFPHSGPTCLHPSWEWFIIILLQRS